MGNSVSWTKFFENATPECLSWMDKVKKDVTEEQKVCFGDKDDSTSICLKRPWWGIASWIWGLIIIAIIILGAILTYLFGIFAMIGTILLVLGISYFAGGDMEINEECKNGNQAEKDCYKHIKEKECFVIDEKTKQNTTKKIDPISESFYGSQYIVFVLVSVLITGLALFAKPSSDKKEVKSSV